MHGQQSFSRRFDRGGFVGVDGRGDQQVIIIQQFESAPTAEPTERAKNKIYVRPRWVDAGFGVEVLEPGYWTDPK